MNNVRTLVDGSIEFVPYRISVLAVGVQIVDAGDKPGALYPAIEPGNRLVDLQGIRHAPTGQLLWPVKMNDVVVVRFEIEVVAPRRHFPAEPSIPIHEVHDPIAMV